VFWFIGLFVIDLLVWREADEEKIKTWVHPCDTVEYPCVFWGVEIVKSAFGSNRAGFSRKRYKNTINTHVF